MVFVITQNTWKCLEIVRNILYSLSVFGQTGLNKPCRHRSDGAERWSLSIQCRPRTDAAESSVLSESTFFYSFCSFDTYKGKRTYSDFRTDMVRSESIWILRVQLNPSGHTTLKRRRINVDATWSRRIDVGTTSFWCCVPAGMTAGPLLFFRHHSERRLFLLSVLF